jgi:hypothetical protein
MNCYKITEIDQDEAYDQIVDATKLFINETSDFEKDECEITFVTTNENVFTTALFACIEHAYDHAGYETYIKDYTLYTFTLCLSWRKILTPVEELYRVLDYVNNIDDYDEIMSICLISKVKIRRQVSRLSIFPSLETGIFDNLYSGFMQFVKTIFGFLCII